MCNFPHTFHVVVFHIFPTLFLSTFFPYYCHIIIFHIFSHISHAIHLHIFPYSSHTTVSHTFPMLFISTFFPYFYHLIFFQNVSTLLPCYYFPHVFNIFVTIFFSWAFQSLSQSGHKI